ncbi:MAG: hypothetical protein ACYDGR_14205 [Candidatus Dormibacteria bacterium]
MGHEVGGVYFASTTGSSRFGSTWPVRIALLIMTGAFGGVAAVAVFVVTHLDSAPAWTSQVLLAGLGVGLLATSTAMLAAVATGDRATWVAPPKMSDAQVVRQALRQMIFAAFELGLVLFWVLYTMVRHYSK